MTWLRKHLRALWVVFAIASVPLLCHIWLVEGAASGETVLLPAARADFSGETLKEGQRLGRCADTSSGGTSEPTS